MSESTMAGPRPAEPGPASEGTTVRPFRVEAAEEEIADRRRRTAPARWPEKEAVVDQSQGVQLATIRVKSPHENALPLVITYGWPGSPSTEVWAAFRSLRQGSPP